MTSSVSRASVGVARASITTTPLSPTIKPVLGSPPVTRAYTPWANCSTVAGSGAATGALGFSSPESAIIYHLVVSSDIHKGCHYVFNVWLWEPLHDLPSSISLRCSNMPEQHRWYNPTNW